MVNISSNKSAAARSSRTIPSFVILLPILVLSMGLFLVYFLVNFHQEYASILLMTTTPNVTTANLQQHGNEQQLEQDQKLLPNPPPPVVVKKEYVTLTNHNLPPKFLWQPLQEPLCLSTTSDTKTDKTAAAAVVVDPFPPNFEKSIYKQQQEHYQTHGRGQGQVATKGQHMRQIINTEIIPKLPGNKLELGPFLNPIIYENDNNNKRKTIKYFDVLDLPGLQQRAAAINYTSVRQVEIDYVNPTGDLTSIPDKESFSLLVSAHVVEHQLDLVRHLNAVSNLLLAGGYYVLMIPDKRFCFDHYVPVTSIADVLEDCHHNRYHDGSHKLKSVIEHRAVTTHNDPVRHWNGDHGPPLPVNHQTRVSSAIAEYNDAKINSNQYVDVHNYQFTPQDFAQIVDSVHGMGLTPMRVHRVYETLKNSLEFVVVLKKCGTGSSAKVD